MAKLALKTLTLLIALFFTFASAAHTNPIDLPDGDFVSIHDPSITLPEADSKRTILLPSEKPDTHPATLVDLDHHSENETDVELTVLNTDEDLFEEKAEEEEKNKPDMLAYRDLRPVWTSIAADQRQMFIRRHHDCHHPHRHPHPRYQTMFHQFNGERPEKIKTEERSYGNDMLVADPEMDKRFEEREGNLENDMLVADPEMERRFSEGELEQDLTEIHVAGGRGGNRHAPDHWVGLHFGLKPRFPDYERHHHHHHEDEEHRRDHRRRGEDEKRPAGGNLVKRFRKFLQNIDL